MANHSPRTSAQNSRVPTDLEGRASQLASLTLMLYGRGREAFNDLFEHDRDNILWLVNDLAAEVRDMVEGGAK
ncbi:MAG: hypothetical protein ACN6PF_20430 [Achromobacter veterisilvae]